MKTVPLTLHLPHADMRFLEEYTKRHKTSITELFDRYIKQLQQHEKQEAGTAIDLEEHNGIIPAHVDIGAGYYQSREEKHR